MKEFLFVGLGGAVGAMLRYGMSMMPVKSEFPYMTLLINFLGAVAIGILAALSMRQSLLTEHSLLLLKTGVCGGFTTFSTFPWRRFPCWSSIKQGWESPIFFPPFFYACLECCLAKQCFILFNMRKTKNPAKQKKVCMR